MDVDSRWPLTNNEVMSEPVDDSRMLTTEQIRPIAEALVRCGLPLLHPEALETDTFHKAQSVLWADTQDGEDAFGFSLTSRPGDGSGRYRSLRCAMVLSCSGSAPAG